MKTHGHGIANQSKVFVWLALVTGLILLIPFIGTQLSDEVTWTLPDFVVMGALLFGGGLALVFSARKIRRHRAVVSGAIVAAFLWVWAELAVGIFTN